MQGSHVLENLENNKFVFQVLEMFLNFTKSKNVLEKNIACEKINSEQKSLWINIKPVQENFDCRRKREPVHSLDIPCQLKFK